MFLKILGYAIIALFFIGLVAVQVQIVGWKNALIITGAVGIIVGLLILSTYLITL